MADLRLNSKKPRMRQMPTEMGQKTAAQPQERTEKSQPFKCKCGDTQCDNEWHSLAMWLAENPATNYGRLLECVEEQIAAFAGLWDGWKNAEGQWIKTCSILTTTPNAVTSAIHDRMPVILDRERYDLWLDPGMLNVAAISELLKPYDPNLMRCYPVSTRVNRVENDDEECSRPIELDGTQNRLFA